MKSLRVGRKIVRCKEEKCKQKYEKISQNQKIKKIKISQNQDRRDEGISQIRKIGPNGLDGGAGDRRLRPWGVVPIQRKDNVTPIFVRDQYS